LGVDTSVFNPELSFDIEKKQDKYVFLNIGKWEVRKGHDILLDLFNTAFPDENDVELWILASELTNSYSSEEELKKWKQMYESPRIKIIPGAQRHSDIAKIMFFSDCGIYPSRAEGWNLEALETMAMNKPIITTNYSAHTEFCNKDNAYLVDILNKEVAFDGKAFKGQGFWAKIDQNQKDQIIDYMRHVYKSNIRTNKNGLETAQKFTWNNTAEIINRCMKK
jgi:glycosyltransferase involved in cell wall biosynthesis